MFNYKYMTFWEEKKNYGDSKKINGCQSLGGGKEGKVKHRGFSGQ